MSMNLRKASSLADMLGNFDREKESIVEPSMVVKCHNMSVQELFTDFCRGIIHSDNHVGQYDDVDQFVDPDPTDLTDLLDGSSSRRQPKSDRKETKDAPSETDERKDKERSDEE